MNLILLIVGMLLIMWGADALTDGAAAVAKRFKIPNIVIGLTIVAFGTSTPELAVSLFSALTGNADIAIGNIVGSNIFNTLIIVGCTALVVPITIMRNTLTKEIPLCILSSLALICLANDTLINGATENLLTRGDGIVLLCFFSIFLSYTFAIAKSSPTSDDVNIKEMSVLKSALLIIGGCAALIAGGKLFVDGASGIARNLGVSEAIIGLTLVAAGTSLPELATSIAAARKNNPEIAIGNAIGSNLFNIFFVLGATATIIPVRTMGITNIDWSTLLLSAILLWFFALFFKERTITRREGAILALSYVVYTGYLVYSVI